MERSKGTGSGEELTDLVDWAFIACLAAVVAVLVTGFFMFRDDVEVEAEEASFPAPDALVDGVDGSVVVTIDGDRTRSIDGFCEVLVRDTSSSVAGSVDPDGQIGRELGAVLDAFGRVTSAVDEGSVVVFAGESVGTGPFELGDSRIADAIVSDPFVGSGTDFDAAFAPVKALLAGCPTGAVAHVTVTTDGEGDPSRGLATLPPGVVVDVVAVAGSDAWTSVAADWTDVDNVFFVEELVTGSFAETYSAVLSELTGHRTLVVVTE